jgi:hypothetical protein
MFRAGLTGIETSVTAIKLDKNFYFYCFKFSLNKAAANA